MQISITDNLRRQRKALLSTSLVGILVDVYAIKPTKLPALGIENLDPSHPLGPVLAIIIAYLLVRFQVSVFAEGFAVTAEGKRVPVIRERLTDPLVTPRLLHQAYFHVEYFIPTITAIVAIAVLLI